MGALGPLEQVLDPPLGVLDPPLRPLDPLKRSSTPFGGPRLPFGGPRPPFGGPRTPLKGPRPPFGGPRTPRKGPRPPFGGPRPPFGGPRTSPHSIPSGRYMANYNNNRYIKLYIILNNYTLVRNTIITLFFSTSPCIDSFNPLTVDEAEVPFLPTLNTVNCMFNYKLTGKIKRFCDQTLFMI